LTELAAPLAGQAVWGYLLSGIALVCFSGAVLATKAASNRANLELGFFVALIVNVVIASGALIVHLLMRGTGLQWNGLAFVLFAASGVFATYLGRWFFYESVVRFGPAKASIFQVSSPLFAALLAWLLLGERLTSLVIIGMVMAIGGLALIAYKPGFFSSSKTTATTTTVHTAYLARILQSVFLLGIFSSAAYAVGNLLRGAAVRSWPEPIAGALIGALTGLAMHYFFSADKTSLAARLRAAEPQGLWLFGLVGAANISGQITTIAAMRYIPLAVAALVGLCTPLLVFPLSYWLFNSQERLTLPVVVGSLLTLLGVAIIVLR
jgi:drug/metabolite transporter (DMT)-like permease